MRIKLALPKAAQLRLNFCMKVEYQLLRLDERDLFKAAPLIERNGKEKRRKPGSQWESNSSPLDQ